MVPEPGKQPPVWAPGVGWQLRRFAIAAIPVVAVGYLVARGITRGHLPGWLTIFGLIVVLIGIGFAAQDRLSLRGRRRRLQSMAAGRGWAYAPADPQLTRRWSTTPFGAGIRRRATDVVTGSHEGMACVLFTYAFTAGDEAHRRRSVLDVIALTLPAALPLITVTPESLIGEISPGVLQTGVGVESETFNRRFRVRTADRKLASDVLPPRTMDAMLSTEPFSWRIDGRDLVAWGRPTTDLATMLTRLDVATTVVRNIPHFVWADSGRPGSD